MPLSIRNLGELHQLVCIFIITYLHCILLTHIHSLCRESLASKWPTNGRNEPNNQKSGCSSATGTTEGRGLRHGNVALDAVRQLLKEQFDARQGIVPQTTQRVARARAETDNPSVKTFGRYWQCQHSDNKWYAVPQGTKFPSSASSVKACCPHSHPGESARMARKSNKLVRFCAPTNSTPQAKRRRNVRANHMDDQVEKAAQVGCANP